MRAGAIETLTQRVGRQQSNFTYSILVADLLAGSDAGKYVCWPGCSLAADLEQHQATKQPRVRANPRLPSRNFNPADGI